MVKKMSIRNILLALSMAIAIFLFLKQIKYTISLNNGVSEIADGYSEANAIRAAQSYIDNGWHKNWGLPDICYGDQFAKFGSKQGRESCIYTHYPPGPDWSVGAMSGICSTGEIGCLRLLPLIVNFLFSLTFAYLLFNLMSAPIKAFLIFALATAVPMYSNMMHGLHYQGYALAVLSVQIVFFMTYLKRPNLLKGLAVFTLAFIQGWLSFDYFFLAVFACIPISIIFLETRSQLFSSKKLIIKLISIGLLGFTLSHFLHFIQVLMFHGSMIETLRDFGFAAAKRFNNSINPYDGIKDYQLSLSWSLKELFEVRSKRDVFLGFSATFLLAVPLVLFSLSKVIRFLGFRNLSIRIEPVVFMGWLSSIVVSVAWTVVMRQHAVVHDGFIPRHLWLFYFCTCYFIVTCIQINSNEDSEKTYGKEP